MNGSGGQIALMVNGKPVSAPPGVSVADLLVQLSLGKGRIAVELNQEIVPRSEYANRVLTEGDRLEIVQAIGGG